MILRKFKRPNSLKTVPSGVVNCRNLPFGRRVTRGTRVRLPREEGAQSLHQRLFKENFIKTKMCGLRTLIINGSGVVFTHGEGISTPHVRHTGRQPLIKWQYHFFNLFYFPFFMFLCFLLFYVCIVLIVSFPVT